MRVYVTGASGWIGSAVTGELLANGYEVTGLARSDSAAQALTARGIAPVRGDLDDPASVRAGAEGADAVIHLGFKHDFDNHHAAGLTERAVVQGLLDTLAGTDRPFLIASGTAFAPGRVAVETDQVPFVGPDSLRGGSERLALDGAERGIRTVALRFSPTVHGHRDHGFVARLFEIARERGTAGYVGDGSSRWSAVHVSDAARMVRLALEKAPAGTAVHGVGEEGIASRDIAAAIGERLGLPTASVPAEQVDAHFGWLGRFFSLDVPASSAITQELLGWTPSGPTLLQDIAAGAYDA